MDKEALELKVIQLFRETEKFSETERVKYLVSFIAQQIEKDSCTFYLDKFDLTNIESSACSAWHDVPLDKKMGGSPLSSGKIRTIMFVKAVVSCLRKYKILHQIVDVKYDD